MSETASQLATCGVGALSVIMTIVVVSSIKSNQIDVEMGAKVFDARSIF